MTDLRKAAEQALEALENHTAIKHPQQRWYRDQAIDALRAALEEPTETVEVINVDSRKISVYDAGVQAMTDDDMIRLANAIRARKESK
jgi:hypothetical protein